jgi:hypothetical protein
VTIVTAASAGYYRALVQFLNSVRQHLPNTPVIVYDLGLTADQQARFSRRFTSTGFPLRPFAFDKHPDFVRRHPGYGAWKAPIIADVLEETRGRVLWLDSATIVRGSLKPIDDSLDRTGFYSPIGGSTDLARWTHPSTLAYLEADDLRHVRNRASGVCAFDYANPAAREVVDEWRRLSLIEECIAPAGATRQNHRFDQSLFTILMNRSGAQLTGDEIDISSTHPIPFLSTRNKVASWVPEWLDFAVQRGYLLWRMLDVLELRVEARFR